jgi:ribonucleases P/MRP protein subunit RPP40
LRIGQQFLIKTLARIFTSKLEHYGIKGHLLDWYRNFLTGRTQRVVFGGARSEPTDLPSGVIQGSVLGPFLFNIFVADLPSCIKYSILKQYADDCTLSKQIKNEKDKKRHAGGLR